MNEFTKCPLECDAGETLLYSAPSDSFSKQENFSLVRCNSCSLVFINPRLTVNDLSSYYTVDYYGDDNVKFDSTTERAVAFFVWWRAFLLSRYLSPSSSVLDIGCGRGNFLEEMARRGHQVYGTELSSVAATRAKSLFGKSIFVGEIIDHDLPLSSFDMITLWHVLEHVGNPMTYLKKSFDLLKPGGFIVIAVPNISSFQAALGGANWFHLDIPRHLYHFSPQTLTKMLNTIGFTIERISHHSIEQNPFGLLQSTLNCLGFSRNFLYKSLKRDPEAILGPLGRLALLSCYYLSMPLAILLAEIESLIGRGGTFYVVGKKAP